MQPRTRIDGILDDAEILEKLQRAGGDAERLAEEGALGQAVDEQHLLPLAREGCR
jgi:hypothetical protein